MGIRILSISANGADSYNVRLACPDVRDFVFRVRLMDGARIVQAPEEFFRLVSSWVGPYGATLAAVGAFDNAQTELNGVLL